MSAYLLRARARFEAAHHLTSYRGGPEPVHGHSWQVEAVVEAESLDEDGIGFDFVELRKMLAELAAAFDHRDLNACPPFDQISPSTERLAEFFYQCLEERLPAARLCEVTVWEGPDCSATYRP